MEKGLEMRKWVLSGILASEETYLSHLEALLLVRMGKGGADQAWWGPKGDFSAHHPRSIVRSWGHTYGRVRTFYFYRILTLPQGASGREA